MCDFESCMLSITRSGRQPGNETIGACMIYSESKEAAASASVLGTPMLTVMSCTRDSVWLLYLLPLVTNWNFEGLCCLCYRIRRFINHGVEIYAYSCTVIFILAQVYGASESTAASSNQRGSLEESGSSQASSSSISPPNELDGVQLPNAHRESEDTDI